MLLGALIAVAAVLFKLYTEKKESSK